VGVALILCVGCRTVSEKGGLNPLPPVPPDATNFSDYEPDNPYLPTGKGVAERSVFTASNLEEGYSVEVRDVLVSPAQPAEISLAGAAVLEVRQGSGKATVGDQHKQDKKEIELSPGTVFTVDDGEPLWLTAYGEPLALRTWVVSSGGEP